MFRAMHATKPSIDATLSWNPDRPWNYYGHAFLAREGRTAPGGARPLQELAELVDRQAGTPHDRPWCLR